MTTSESNIKYVTSLPKGEKIVGIVEHDGKIFIASSKGVYKLVECILEPIEFKHIPPKKQEFKIKSPLKTPKEYDVGNW